MSDFIAPKKRSGVVVSDVSKRQRTNRPVDGTKFACVISGTGIVPELHHPSSSDHAPEQTERNKVIAKVLEEYAEYRELQGEVTRQEVCAALIL